MFTVARASYRGKSAAVNENVDVIGGADAPGKSGSLRTHDDDPSTVRQFQPSPETSRCDAGSCGCVSVTVIGPEVGRVALLITVAVVEPVPLTANVAGVASTATARSTRVDTLNAALALLFAALTSVAPDNTTFTFEVPSFVGVVDTDNEPRSARASTLPT